MFVFLAVALGGGFVDLRRRRGRHRCRRLVPRRRGLEWRCRRSATRRRRPRRTRRASQRGVSCRPPCRPRARSTRRSTPRIGSSCWPEGCRRAPRARGALPLAGEREAAAGSDRSAQGGLRGAGQNFPGALTAPTGSRSSTTRSSQTLNAQSSTSLRRSTRGPSCVGLGRRRLQEDRCTPAGRPKRSARAGAGRPAGRRHGVGDRRLAAFLKLAPDDPNAAIVKQQLKQLRQTSAASG